MAVNSYTGVIKTLSWLRNEEAMTDYGYRHKDHAIGTFYSRFTLDDLKAIDMNRGKPFGTGSTQQGAMKQADDMPGRAYSPFENPFLYEFNIHVSRRDNYYDKFLTTNNLEKKISSGNSALKENMLLEKYFGNTLSYYAFTWGDDKTGKLRNMASLRNGNYASGAGRIVISFRPGTAWMIISVILIGAWTSCGLWVRRAGN